MTDLVDDGKEFVHTCNYCGTRQAPACVFCGQEGSVENDEVARLTARVAELEERLRDQAGRHTEELHSRCCCKFDPDSGDGPFSVCKAHGHWRDEAVKGARAKALREAARVSATRGLDYVVGHSDVKICEKTAADIAHAVLALLDKEEDPLSDLARADQEDGLI